MQRSREELADLLPSFTVRAVCVGLCRCVEGACIGVWVWVI